MKNIIYFQKRNFITNIDKKLLTKNNIFKIIK